MDVAPRHIEWASFGMLGYQCNCEIGKDHEIADNYTLDPTLYDCVDCFAEALMDIQIYDGRTVVTFEELTRFNRMYKFEYRYAHIDLDLPIRK